MFLKCFLIESDVAFLIREQLPFLFASTIDQNRGTKATLLRSPDRQPGLKDINRPMSRIKESIGCYHLLIFIHVICDLFLSFGLLRLVGNRS